MKNPFKNFKTKKQLREEIAFLKGTQFVQPQVLRVERNIIKHSCRVIFDGNVPADHLKRRIMEQLCHQIEPFIEWDVVATDFCNSLIGSIYIAEKKV